MFRCDLQHDAHPVKVIPYGLHPRESCTMRTGSNAHLFAAFYNDHLPRKEKGAQDYPVYSMVIPDRYPPHALTPHNSCYTDRNSSIPVQTG